MRRIIYLLMVVISLSMSSCCTLLTSSSQQIYFNAPPQTRIYYGNQLIARTNDEGVGNARIKKEVNSKTLMAKKKGYQNTPFVLQSRFNPLALGNFVIGGVLGFIVDFATGQICYWDNDNICIEMERNNSDATEPRRDNALPLSDEEDE